MATPVWFDANAYVMNKAAQLGMGTDSLQALAAFKDAGWGTDADSLYNHFVQYGNAEGVSPNAWFDVNDYLYSKGQSFYNTTSVSTSQLKSLEATFKATGWSAWDHYSKGYWAEDYATKGFLNPSAEVNIQKYMEDKLAQMKTADSTYTMDKLVKAFQDAGMDPVTHFYLYGQNEGLKMTGAEGNLPGKTFSLTAGDDEIIGSNGADYIKAPEGTLGSNDYIDGMGGNDALYANINTGPNNNVISPEIRNVETVLFRAQTDTNISNSNGGNNLTDAYFDAENVTFDDAKAELTIGSDNSRANMTIEDVRWNSNQTTIRFSNTDPGDVDLDVFFDPQHLASDDAVTTGKLKVELIDTVGALTTEKGGHNNALWDNPYTGFKFMLNGTEHTLNFGVYNNSTDKAPSYEALMKQMQAAIDKDPALSKLGITVSMGDPFDARVGIGNHKGETVNGKQIVLTTDQGELKPGNWIASNGLPATNSTSATFSDDADTTCPLIQTNVELDNVGRVDWNADTDCLPNNIINGSNAGDLTVGSMADRGGIERMDITVDRGSWLSSISSTNETLRMITVKGGDIDGNGKADDGALYIGDWVGSGEANGNQGNTGVYTWTDAARFLQANNGPRADDDSGLNDVAIFDATGYKGDINIGADITSASYDKYLKDVDGVKGPDGMAPLAGYNNTFTYITGEGNDVINMSVEGAIAADNDFKMNISTGKGDDLVGFRYENMSANQSLNQKNLHNVTIDTGEGNDTVWFYGSHTSGDHTTFSDGGSVIINTGAGNDVIYANQQEFFTGGSGGTVTLAPRSYNAVFVFNTSDTTIGNDDVDKVVNFSGATLRNDMAVGATSFKTVGNAANETMKVEVTFKGHTASINLGTFNSTSAVTYTAEQINHAIIKAIADDPVLQHLLVAKDGAGHTLIIESLINGGMELGDLSINFKSYTSDNKAGVTTLDTGNWYNTAFGTLDNTVSTEFKGNNSTSSQVTVDAGDGDDLIVLGQNGTLMDIVKVSGGNDTLIGFTNSDMISVSGVLDTSKALNTTAGRTALVNNTAIVAKDLASNSKNAIFTQAEVNKLITDKLLQFTDTTTAGTAVVLLEDKDDSGNFVYTIVKLVNGSTVTGTILGTYTLDQINGVAQEIANGQFTIDDVMQTSITGMTYDAYSSADTTFSGTTLNDTFNNLNTTSLAHGGNASTLITAVYGGTGNDTFNVTDSMSGVIVNGGFGDDKFVISHVDGQSGSYAGGEGNDTLTITSTVAAVNFGSRITQIETVEYAGTGNLTFSGDAYLKTVSLTDTTKASNVTLDATLSTELTVNLVAGTATDTIKLGASITSLDITNFSTANDDVLQVGALLSGNTVAVSHTVVSGGIDMTSSNIAVLTDIETLTTSMFSTSAAAAGKIQIGNSGKYLFVASNGNDDAGNMYYVTTDASGAVEKFVDLGVLGLQDAQQLQSLDASNFTI